MAWFHFPCELDKQGWVGGWMDGCGIPSLVREDLLQVKVSLDLIIREGKAVGETDRQALEL